MKSKHSKENIAFKTSQQFLALLGSEGKWRSRYIFYANFNENSNQFLQVLKSNLSVRVTLHVYHNFGVRHSIFQSGIYC